MNRSVRPCRSSDGEAGAGDVLVLAPLRAEADDLLDPGVVQGPVVAGGPGVDDGLPVADVEGAEFHDPLAGRSHAGLVERVDLDAGAPACAVEAGQGAAGDVVAADRAAGGVDPGEA